MDLRQWYQVLVLIVGSITISWLGGCAGVANPLPSLSVTPSVLSVNAKVGASSSQTVLVTNVGTIPLSVSQAVVTGTGFSVSGLTTPMTLAPSQTQTFTVKFSAQGEGTVDGNLAIMTDAAHRPVVASLKGKGSKSSPSVTSVSVTPTVATAAPSAKVQFSAAVQGSTTNDTVQWTATMGAVSATGVYTAPTSAGTGTVTATSVADPTKSASAVVTVRAAPINPPSGSGVTSVAITPGSASTAAGGTLSFSAVVSGTTTNRAVTWHASTGSISAAGVYTAPAAAGTSVVTATSVADPTKVGSATIAVTAAPTNNPSPSPTVTGVTVSPATASSVTGGTLPFTASVSGTTTNKAVAWKAALGTISAAGIYTAPAKAGTDTVTATSVADSSKSAVASVTVTSAPANPTVTGVTMSPSSTSVNVDSTVQFTATVLGTVTNKSVTWSAALGNINALGVYTAPAKAGSDIVTATSVADPSKSASSAVTVEAASATSSQTALCGGSGCPAFPEAEGSAAGAVGGRGGVVIEVTNLNDSGTGSLRSCIEASGARTCVFRVGGVIQVSGDLRIGNPYLTIAGQTAPGGGIKLVGTGAIMWVNTHDVVIRYLSYDGNSPNSGPSVGSVSFDAGSGNVYNVIFDHVSGFHVTNKQLIVLCNDSGPVKNVTFQWNMTYKPDVNHPVGPMADATTCAASTVTDIDYHHNFFADTSHRLPLFNVKSGRWVNNIVYNWDWFAGLWQGATTPDIINNRYIPGSMNSGDNSGHPHPMEFASTQSTDDTSQSMQGAPSVFLSGNSGPQGSDVAITGRVDSEGGAEIGAVPSSWFRSSPLPSPTFPITADPASSLEAVLLSRVGNSQQITCDGAWSPRRQSEDVAMIAEYQSRAPGSLWSAPSGYATASVSNGTPCTESLHDGIPDQWKTKYGLSVSDGSLRNKTAPNGYTYLENYLNGTDPTM